MADSKKQSLPDQVATHLKRKLTAEERKLLELAETVLSTEEEAPEPEKSEGKLA